MFEVEKFPAPPWRRRLLVLALALLTAWLVLSNVLGRPGGADFKPPPRPDKAACKPGETVDCVGGTATVIVAPPAASAVAR